MKRRTDEELSESWQRQASQSRDDLAAMLMLLYSGAHLTFSQARETAALWNVKPELEKRLA